MSGFKMMSVEPTAEMMWAAQEADMDHSDHDEWLELDGDDCKRMYRAMLAAAPAVQGEPVAYRYRHPTEDWEGMAVIHPSTFHPDHAQLIVQPLYTAPQPEEQRCEYCDGTGDVHSLDGEWRGTCDCPAGQQPEPISRNLRAVHAMILSALDRDAADGKAVRGEMAAELRSALSEQQPAPDVARLVGEDAESDVAGLVEALQGALNGRPLDTEFWDRCEQFISAHRKQGGEV